MANKLNITEDELVALAAKQYGGPVCCDLLNDAMEAGSLDEAISILTMDSEYWDNGWDDDDDEYFG